MGILQNPSVSGLLRHLQLYNCIPTRNNKAKAKAKAKAKDDHLSNLPDDILSTIISLLPLKDGAKTTVLSSRWRHLWSLSPLDFDDAWLHPDKGSKLYPSVAESNRCTHVTNHILLSSHRGPIRSFRLSCFPSDVEQRLELWFRILRKRGLQQLFLSGFWDWRLNFFAIDMPSLRLLELRHCILMSNPAGLGLPSLKVLILRDTLISNSLSCFFSNCMALENLQIYGDCYATADSDMVINISSQSLTTLVIDCGVWSLWTAAEVVIEDAPNLRRLILGRHMTTSASSLRIVHAPNIQELGFINLKFKLLQLGTTCLQYGVPSNMSTLLYCVKKIAISMDTNNIQHAKMGYNLLRCFPCLETLDILFFREPGYFEISDYWEQQPSLDCIKLYLKRINLDGIRDGTYTNTGFVKFLILKAQVLKVMTIYTQGKSSRKCAGRIKHLFLENRGSPDAQVNIVDDRDGRKGLSSPKNNFPNGM